MLWSGHSPEAPCNPQTRNQVMTLLIVTTVYKHVDGKKIVMNVWLPRNK